MGLLELLFLQLEINEFPAANWLSSEFKRRTYQKEYEPLYLDEKVLQLEAILASDLSIETKRLAQKSFYLGAKEALSKRTTNPAHPWRRTFISTISQEWQWQAFDFTLLDQRNEASYQFCPDEHQLTQNQLKRIHSDIKQFAQQQNIDQNDLLSLRKAASKYPLYITGITFQNDQVNTVYDFIHQKQRLEKLLNTD